MNSQESCWSNTLTSVNVNQCDFAELKYEQLLSDKYFVETCFSRKEESYDNKQRLRDSFVAIRLNKCH